MTLNPILEKKMSTVVTAMRFPLIILVVFSHSLGFETPAITADLTAENGYHFFSEMISHNFAKIAVCWFFVFSGYFFFKSLKQGDFSFRWLWGRWEKRIWSLVLPYLMWNLILVAVTLIKTWSFCKVGLGDDGGIEYIRESGPLFWFWTGPVNFPLWYMRDLICMSLVAPLIYWVFSRFKYPGLVALILIYASPLNPSLPGFSMRAIAFFGIGAWMGIWKVNLLEVCRKARKACWVLAPALLVLSTCFNASSYHEWFLRLFYPFGMIFMMNLIDRICSSAKAESWLVKMSETVFFIYVTHEIFILGWTKGAWLRLLGDSVLAQSLRYVLVPVTVLGVCIGLYYLIRKIAPRTLGVLLGGRIKKANA